MSLTVLPTLYFDSGGSDTAASGDNTVAAISGTAGNVTNTSTTATITDAVNLASVPLDGSAVLWIQTTSGRQYSRISNITGSSGSWTLTLEDSTWTTSTNKSWAIGGKRATIDNANSRNLFTTSAKSGWTIQINTNVNIGGTGTIILAAAGDTTTGPVTITGNADSGSQPVITTTANIAAFTINTSGRYYFRKLAFQCSSATRTTAYGINATSSTSPLLADNCIFGDSTNQLANGIKIASNTPLRIQDCELKNCTGAGLNVTAGSGPFDIENCNVHNNGAGGISIAAAATSVSVEDCTVWANTNSDGIAVTAAVTQELSVERCTIHSNDGHGVNLGSVAHAGVVICNNNITANGQSSTGYGVSTTNAALDKTKYFVDYNNFGTGGTANTSGNYQNVTAGAHDLAVDPGYTNAATGNFTITSSSNVIAKGYPDSTRKVGGNTGVTVTYVDMGASQAAEAGGGGVLFQREWVAGLM